MAAGPDLLETQLDRRLSLGLFFLSFAVYVATAYPCFAPRDSADLALAALKLGVAHPPGYPLYALLGRLWLWLMPFGNPDYRLNVMSAAAGGGACAAAFLLARRFAGRLASAAAALAVAFSAPVWKFSLLSEMYSLHLLFFLVLLLLAEGSKDTLSRRTQASGLVLGLGLVNHQSLLLSIPAVMWVWRAELRRHKKDLLETVLDAAPWVLLGWMVYGFVWLRLGSLRLAWAVITRAEYGSLTLSPAFSRALTARSAAALLAHWAAGTAAGAGPLAVVLALFGFLLLRKRRPAPAQALLLALLFTGPAYFLMSRLDLSEWVAATILESSFAVGVAVACLFAAAGLDAVAASKPVLAAPLASILALGPLWISREALDHREDFSAYDYARDLRRELPPGSAVLAGGDTALFGLKLLDAERPRSSELRLVSARENPDPSWASRERGRGRVFALGLPVNALQAWGVAAPKPEGLVQEIAPDKSAVDEESAAWRLSILRWGPPLAGGESYAHDVRLAYAFAHYLSARFEEASDPRRAAEHDRWARLQDPEDYHVEWIPMPAQNDNPPRGS